MIIEWPVDVPYQPGAGSMNIAPIDELARTDFDQGPERTRRRFTQLLGEVSFTIMMTGAEYEGLKSFYLTDTRNGSRWFRMPLYQRGFVGYDVKFAETYKAASEGPGFWRVSVKLKVRDIFVPRTDADIWAATLWEPGNEDAPEEIIAISDIFHPFVHTTYATVLPE